MDDELAARALALDPATLGTRIRALRLARGLTQRQLAGSEASTAYVSRIEAGDRRPGLALLTAFAQRLGASVEDLVSEAPVRRSDRARLELDHAEIELRTGEADAALARLEPLLAAGAGGGLDHGLVDGARVLRARALEATGRIEEAIDGLEGLLADAARRGADGDPGGTPAVTLLPALIALSRCYRETGDLGRALQVGDRARGLLDEHALEGSAEGVQLALTIAAAAFERGDTAHAAHLCRHAIERAEALDSDVAKGSAFWNASIIASRRGDQPSALAFARRALHHLEREDDARHLVRLKTDLGIILLRSDPPQLADATALLEAAAHDLATTDASPVDRARNGVALARVLTLDGALDRAEALLREAGLPAPTDAPLVAADAEVAWGSLEMARRDITAARDRYLGAVRHLTAVGADRSAAELWFELAGLLESTGLMTDALDAYRRAAASAGLRAPARPERQHADQGADG